MSVYADPRAERKAEIGAGVVPMTYGTHISTLFGKDDHTRLKAAQLLYHTNPWVNAAERAVTGKFANVDWHLEDENDDEISDDAGTLQKQARDLLEKPQAALPRTATQGLSRRSLWSLTSRHMGLCGTTFWFADQMDLNGIPFAFLYINPVRMTPVSNPSGYLIGYRLDAEPWDINSGYPLTLDEVLRFDLDPGDTGHWGIGLAEASGILDELWMLAARHSGGVLGSGGRIAGITMPKPGVEMDDDAWKSLVRDMRSISEDPNATKRNLILKKPMDFIRTAASPQELDLFKGLELERDDILGYWGVPKSQIGLDVPTGLNSGGTKDRDLQVLWQGSVHSRLVPFAEVIQFQLLDRFKAVGLTLELEIEEPDFTEDKPRYENAQLALSQPLRNRERREVLGLEPFGDPILDEAVWMPLSMTAMFTAPDAQGKPVPQQEVEEQAEPSTIEAKATVGKRPLMGLRRQVDAKWLPRVQASVAEVLRDQRAEVTAKAKRHAEHLRRKPTDHVVWWDEKKWDRLLADALKGHASAIAEQVASHVDTILSTKKAGPRKRPSGAIGGSVGVAEHEAWEPAVRDRVIAKVGLRVTGINRTTRDAVVRTIQETVAKGIEDGLGAAQLGDALETALDDAATFDESRAELIARTETAQAYNASALGSYAEFGIEMVEPLDGDQDPECIARLERGPVSLEDAEADEDHPNGTLDWVPYFPEETEGKASVMGPRTARATLAYLQVLAEDEAKTEDRFFALAETYARAAEAMSREAPPTNVTVNVPEIIIPAPVVNVAAPAATPAPVVDVTVPKEGPKTIRKNADGSYTITEGKA